MRYLFHENQAVIYSNEPPPHCTRYLISGANCTYMAFQEGYILVQDYECEGFTISVSHILLDAPLTLQPLFDKSVVLIHYLLNGTVAGESDSFTARGLVSGLHHMYYIPATATHSVSLVPGHYHAILIDIPIAFLLHAAERMNGLRALADALSGSSLAGIQLPSAPIDFRIRTLLNEITMQRSADPGADLLVQAKIYELIWLYLQHTGSTDREAGTGAYNIRMQQVRDYVDIHLGEELNTTFLAARFTISRTTLKRQFKNAFGKTIRDYIISQRMMRARELLLHTDMSISTVGSEVGYAEFSSFSRAFKKHFGYAPVEVRRDQDKTEMDFKDK